MAIAKEIPYELVSTKLRYEQDTGHLYWIGNVRKRYIGKKAGSIKKDGYVRLVINGESYPASRVAWVLAHGSIPKDMQIDHIDRVRTNNKLSNLRLVTIHDNAMNKSNKFGESEPRYYTMHKCGRVQVAIDQKYVGLFKTVDDALAAIRGRK